MITNVNGWHMYSTELEAYRAGMTALDLPDADYPGSFVHEVLHFIDCIERRQEPLSSGRDNLRTIAVVDALYQSAATGQATEIERL